MAEILIPDKHWDRLLAREPKIRLTREQLRQRSAGIIILSPEQQEIATAMHEKGASMRGISQSLGVSRTTVSNFLNRKYGYAVGERNIVEKD